MGWLFCIILLVDVFSTASFMLFAANMFIVHFDYCLKNATTLEDMGGTFSKINRNPFDWGVLYNLKAIGVLGWLFWFPTLNLDKYEGYYSPRIDRPELVIEKRGVRGIEAVVKGKIKELKSLEEMVKVAEESYVGYTMLFEGEAYK